MKELTRCGKVVNVLHGEQDAVLSELVSAYWRSIWAFIYSITSDIELTNDLTQETFVLACRRLEQLRNPQAMRTWLFSIARNQCRDHFKSAWFRRVVAVGANIELAPMAAVASTEQTVMEEIEHNDIWQAIHTLQAGFREVVLLRIREELSFREIAVILGIREGTARSRYGRAVESLRRTLGQGGDHDGI